MYKVELKLPPVKRKVHGPTRVLSSYTIERRNRITIITIHIAGVTIILEIPP